MYWLIGILIIIAMISVLAVADGMALSLSPLLVDTIHVSLWPLYLIVVAIILGLVTQRSRLAFRSVNTKHLSFQPLSRHLPSTLRPSSRILHYCLVAVLAAGLLIGSALQSLIGYQQAEITKITDPIRVQAWVRIEGISDSVYDVATDSGYRQVATIEQLSPLVSQLTPQHLDVMMANYRAMPSNRLSGKSSNDKDLAGVDIKNTEYRVLLNAYPKKQSATNDQLLALNNLQPGDQLLMTLALAPLATSEQATTNPTGFDSYRWLRSRHIDGVATILATSTSTIALSQSSALVSSDSYFKRLRTNINQGRWQLRQHFYQAWSQQTLDQQQADAVTLSLLTGDRSLINRPTKDLYQLAGISHLLAISGTHVLFLAIILAGAAVLVFDRLSPKLYRHIPRWQVRWWVMISAAFIYALFTGFDVPAARTAWMLLAIGLVRLTLLPIGTMRVLLALAVLMAWFDPYVLWQAGYWLSFIAVGLLLRYEDAPQQSASENIQTPRSGYTVSARLIQIKPVFKRIFRLQCWLFIALLPITLLLFGKASLWGLVINLFAIGLFGWVIVPLNLLAGLCYLILPAVADSLWVLVSAIVASLHDLLSWLTGLSSLKGAWLYTPVNTGILLMALLVLLPWLLPRGLISRALALPPLTLLMMTVYANQQALSLTPTLYILPTGDRYLSAAVLHYPVHDSETTIRESTATQSKESSTTDSVSWLFLADHRTQKTRTMPSSLTPDQLATTLDQQLRTLSIKRLEGVVVQTSSAALTDTLATKTKRTTVMGSNSELLPMTVAQLTQRLPTHQYWQAGRSNRWSSRQQVYANSDNSKHNVNISAQPCKPDKTWQLEEGQLSLQAITGWSKIDDASVWDCTVAIDSKLPIRVLKYNAADPLKSALLSSTTITNAKATVASSNKDAQKEPQSRIVLDASTHQRVWQLWSLLCIAEPFATSLTSGGSIAWLSHSASTVSTEVLTTQHVTEVMTYDNAPLEVAFATDDP